MATRRQAPPLTCHACGTARPGRLAVPGAQQRLRSRGTARVHAYVRCRACGHEWWSTAREALRRARAADARAAAR